MKYYDLTGTLKKGIWYYGAPYIPFETDVIADLKDNGYIARKLTMTTHTGTHIQCGAHWWEDAQGVDLLDLSKFIGSARVFSLDCKQKPLCGDPRDSIDFVSEDLMLPDYVLLKNGIPYLLEMVHLEELPEMVNFVGFPLKIAGADGSPVRAVAWDLE